MKKVIYIALVGAGLFTVSCSKQNIKPNSEETTALPVWKSAAPAASTSTEENAGIFMKKNKRIILFHIIYT